LAVAFVGLGHCH